MMRITAVESIFVIGKKYVNKILRRTHTRVKPLFNYALEYGETPAIFDDTGRHSHRDILNSAIKLSKKINGRFEGNTTERILFLCPNNSCYMVMLWAIWMTGHTAVPLSVYHPEKLMNSLALNLDSKLLITIPEYERVIEKIAAKCGASVYAIRCSDFQIGGNMDEEYYKKMLSRFNEWSGSFILHTSMNNGDVKGVVLTHNNILSTIQVTSDMWKMTPQDVVLNALPLHHAHGIIFALFLPLYAGGSVVMLPRFSPGATWEYLLGKREQQVSVFMGVPLMYAKLIEKFERTYKKDKEIVRRHLETNLRLMVSSSTPLPTSIAEKWYEISGHHILERYGMTEIGIGLCNEYDHNREPGYVGVPPPGTTVRIVNSECDSRSNLECENVGGMLVFNRGTCSDVQGELWVKGPSVFKGYYNDRITTKNAFTKGGWFKTGDICEYSREKQKFRILGRIDVDLIKSGTNKIGAKQIEKLLMGHPSIKEAVVIGVKDEACGERVAVLLVPQGDIGISLTELRRWLSDTIPGYSLPAILKIVSSLPKDGTGKVDKRLLLKNLSSFYQKATALHKRTEIMEAVPEISRQENVGEHEVRVNILANRNTNDVPMGQELPKDRMRMLYSQELFKNRQSVKPRLVDQQHKEPTPADSQVLFEPLQMAKEPLKQGVRGMDDSLTEHNEKKNELPFTRIKIQNEELYKNVEGVSELSKIRTQAVSKSTASHDTQLQNKQIKQSSKLDIEKAESIIYVKNPPIVKLMSAQIQLAAHAAKDGTLKVNSQAADKNNQNVIANKKGPLETVHNDGVPEVASNSGSLKVDDLDKIERRLLEHDAADNKKVDKSRIK